MAQRLPMTPGSCDQTINGISRAAEPKGQPPAMDHEIRSATGASMQANPDGAESPSTENDIQEELYECAICLQTCIHPVKLPCSHIFCFLCVKGVAIQSKRCALCRQDIPVDYFNNPSLLRKEDLLKECAFEGGYQWYYQGINGWWQYDERASSEIEKQFNEGSARQMEILIAGFLYIIDFDNMLQFRRNDPSRRRKIKRDLITIPDKKGVAGLKVVSRSPEVTSPVRPQGDGGENVPCVVQQGASPSGTSKVRQNNVRTMTQMTSAPASMSSPTSPQAPHNTPEDHSQQERQELTGEGPNGHCPTTRNRSRLNQGQAPASRPTRRQQPTIPEQSGSGSDNLSSQFMNLTLEETPRASRSTHRTRVPRSQPQNKKPDHQQPADDGNTE